MQVTLCDWRDDKGKPCGERSEVEVQLTQDGKRYIVDLCQVHQKPLVANAREAGPTAPVPTQRVTVLPRSTGGTRKTTGQLVDKIDYPDMRNWLVLQGKIKADAKGRISAANQQMWIDAGEPRPI